MSDGRFVCTKDYPWSPEDGRRASHPDAEYVDEDIGWGTGESSYDVYRCPWCNLTFRVEVPQ